MSAVSCTVRYMYRLVQYTVMAERQPRQRLLDAAVAHALAHGVGDLSLRELAAAIGTSHRMLIYHFGSKAGLFGEIIRAVEAAQRQVFGDLADAGLSMQDAARAYWRQVSDPSMWPQERLFFELYGQALQGRPGTAELLDGIVDSWIEPMAAYATAHGTPVATARVDARLNVAVVRGLLLDLLATGDRAAVDAAFELYLSRSAAVPARSAGRARTGRG
jgi:AcrR family transcriptional regulator